MNTAPVARLVAAAPAVLGVGAAITLPAVGGTGVVPLLLASVFAAAGAAATWAQARARARQAEQLAGFVAGQAGFAGAVAPVWAGHLESSRSQMEAAVGSLAQRFGAIVQRLDQTAGISAGAGAGGAEALGRVYTEGEAELGAVVHSLQQAMQSKAHLLDEVRQLARFIAELKQMASDVGQIAQHTNLLAINAAIAAAHAGDAGRGFAVVAQEVRKLSAQSGEAGRRIAETVDAVSGAIVSTQSSAEAAAIDEARTVEQSRSTISHVLDRLRGTTDAMAAAGEQLRQESLGIKGEVTEALVQLQFQDRVGQVLAHVKASIDSLPATADAARAGYETEGRLEVPDAAAFLRALEATYAMADERALHHGQAAAPAAPAEEVTFF